METETHIARYGHFDIDKREYVIEKVNTPVSWTNYLGTEKLVGVFNQTAGGYLFYESAEHHRITRFRANGVPADRPGHYVYIRDDETGDYWSISWQPVAKPAECYRARHGLSYSVYECDYSGIHAEQTLFIPHGTDTELWDIRLENRGKKTRKLSIFSYAELSFHEINSDHKNFQATLYCAGASYKDGVIVQELHYEDGGFQFFTSDFSPDGFEIERERFTGTWQSESNPEAVVRGSLAGHPSWTGGNQCAVLHKRLELTAGAGQRLCFMLGEGNAQAAGRIRARFSPPEERDAAFAALAAFWDKKLAILQVSTPNADMNTMLNIWTLYQSSVNVLFSRFASFIEVGGRTGLGYRDTSQDAMCVVASNTEACRQRLMQLLRALVSEGYGLHLFEPEWFDPRPKPAFHNPTVVPAPERASIVHGLEHACSDDALWLVAAVAEYIRETGDAAFADIVLPYADEMAAPDSVYEHCKKIVQFSGRMIGSHGICLGLRADWNDCLNLGGGESAMVSYLYLWALDHLTGLARFLRRNEDAEAFRSEHSKAAKICAETLWDGDWYLRGFTKTGRPIGTNKDREGKIHLESNVWAVIAGADAIERGRQAMDSVWEHLGTPYGLMLNAPAYTHPDDDVGFITRVYPGLKENGAVFSHPNPWAWIAECTLGRGDKAMELYRQLCPATWNDDCNIRKAEPYSTCQFITGKAHPAFGEAHHPFMTGSGGWSYFAATQYILGLRAGFDGLVLDPCIPSEWRGFHITRRFRGAEYRITVKNPANVCAGIGSLRLNGKPIPVTQKRGTLLPLLPAGDSCEIEAIMA
ncbi:MAG: N,N'-diacetylchitobiose phosphorylase [Spirochaetaceae bacterium]|jgi:N,N'-diacetylchitobiose phosphorylase|nr:N,N'-diacetylchitobiose phosphorylase [Spirochaetaceae bacterium]